jgi:hypothetical protein
MNNLKLEYTKPDEVYKTTDAFHPKEEVEEVEEVQPLPRFFRVDIEKILESTIYIQTPHDVDLNNLQGYEKRRIISDAVNELLTIYDWDDHDLIDINRVDEITEEHTKGYDVYEL